MTTDDLLQGIKLDYLNGKSTLDEVLWEAYAYGRNDPCDCDG